MHSENIITLIDSFEKKQISTKIRVRHCVDDSKFVKYRNNITFFIWIIFFFILGVWKNSWHQYWLVFCSLTQQMSCHLKSFLKGFKTFCHERYILYYNMSNLPCWRKLLFCDEIVSFNWDNHKHLEVSFSETSSCPNWHKKSLLLKGVQCLLVKSYISPRKPSKLLVLLCRLLSIILLPWLYC